MPGSFPTHLTEDGDIAPRFAVTERQAVGEDQLLTKLGAAFDRTVGQFVAAIELYCKVVWPVFYPYSDLWERNARKETTVMDMIVLILALPGVIVAIAMAAWGLRVAAIAGACLHHIVGSLGSGLLPGW